VILLFSGNTNGALLQSTSLNLQETNLVRCLTYISQRYFAPGRSLVISSPANYRDVQKELIAEIHRFSIWPVVVTGDGKISKTEESDFIDRDGSYIILIPDGNINSFKVELTGLAIARNKFRRLWNSESRFVVAGANDFSTTQQMEIFDFFSNFRIYNCIIISQEPHVIDKEYSRPKNVKDIDTGMKLVMYTWFPYRSSESCTEVKDITLLDTWVISAKGHFIKNTDLFPGKNTNNPKQCRMKVVVRDTQNYFTTKYVRYRDPNGNVRSYIRGFEYNLLMVVLKQMNMPFDHVPTPKNFEQGGGNLINNLFFDMFRKQIYLALGNVGTHSLMISFIDSTNPYHMLSMRWYVPCSVKYSRWSSIFRILSVELWLVLFLSIVTAAISTTLVGRYSCTSEWQRYKTLTSSLTNVWAVILGVSVSTMPRTPSLRSLFLAWVCFSLAFSTVFQTFLTTFLIDSGYETPIQNMDELFASSVKLAYPPGFNSIFEKGDEIEASKIKRKCANCSSHEVCLDWAKYQKNVSILLFDQDAEDNYARGYFVGENSEPLLCRLEDGVVYSFGLSMIMFHGDPLMKRVTEIIDRVVEAGLYNYWISLRMFLLKFYSRKITIVHALAGYYSFNLYHMQPAFYLILIGWCLSALCFMIEVLYNLTFRKRM